MPKRWPTQPVKLLDAFPPGAPGDLIARLIQPALQKELGQPVIVDNRPGAGGNIGASEVVRSSDAHTVLVGPDTMLTINPYLYRKLAFDPMSDLVPVTQLATFSQELVCNPAVGVKSLDELLAATRKEPMSYASGGQACRATWRWSCCWHRRTRRCSTCRTAGRARRRRT